MKEFTVGDMIRALAKLDPELPVYDHYYDEDVQKEVWFNVARPRPKKQTIYLKGTHDGETLTLAWSEKGAEGKTVDRKKVVVLYPPEEGVIEI